MGQKVNPKALRTGVITGWPSRWFSDDKKQFIKNLEEDVKTRKFLTREFREAGVDKVEIERSANKVVINIHTAKPGIIIGRSGKGIEDLKAKIHKKFLCHNRPGDININVFEVDRPSLSSNIIVQQIAADLEKRVAFRRTMKQAIQRVERAGSLGVKIMVKGRLNGAEIAREEKLSSGSIPLHTIRADINYSRGTAFTTYGAIGIKVWIYRGEVFAADNNGKGEIVGRRKK
ncbi:MAG: 30S ribosomal protein S3 [Patescibacteria group bacterium]|jgi:small subunit ribosomal protein S3